MKKILFPILMVLVVIGSAVVADFLKNDGSTEEHVQTPSKKKKPNSAKDHTAEKKEKKSKSKGDHGDTEYSSGDISYLKFKRQFVVPVMDQGKIDALIIMNLNLVLDSHAPSNAYSYEPKLRDALTRELLTLSNEGLFGEGLTTAQNYEIVRSTLLTACRSVISEGIQDILILDIARQEY